MSWVNATAKGMTKPRAYSTALLSALAWMGLGACAPTSTPEIAQDAPPPCTAETTRYLAFVPEGRCAEVAGGGGLWHAAPLFPDAPPSIRDAACSFAWRAIDHGAPADVGALQALRPEALTEGVQATDACAATRLSSDATSIVPLPHSDGLPGPLGVAGCEVCARVMGREVYAILPADHPNPLTIAAIDARGLLVLVEVALGSSTQAFVAELPALRDGGSYREGRAQLIEAK